MSAGDITVGALRAIDQADTALGVAGLSENDIFRAELREARAVIAELISADKEYDAALTALKDLNRKIAEHGWMDVEHGALRTASTRLVNAEQYRRAILARIEGAA